MIGILGTTCAFCYTRRAAQVRVGRAYTVTINALLPIGGAIGKAAAIHKAFFIQDNLIAASR